MATRVSAFIQPHGRPGFLLSDPRFAAQLVERTRTNTILLYNNLSGLWIHVTNISLLREIQTSNKDYFASEKRDASVQFYDDIYIRKTILKYFAINCQWCGSTSTKFVYSKIEIKLNFTVWHGQMCEIVCATDVSEVAGFVNIVK